MIDKSQACALPDVSSTSYLFNGVRLCTRVMPARRAVEGGDWCETFVVSGDIVALSIGDVCGHGAGAVAAMLATRQVIREAALRGRDPARALTEANRSVCDFDSELHVTALIGFLDTRLGTVTFANAGHPPPLVVRRSGSNYLSYAVSDLPLGVENELMPALRVARIPPQTLLVFYTDGVTEHERRPLRGAAQLRNAAVSAYRGSTPPTATVIENLMFLTEHNADDASILTAWTPHESLGRTADATRRPRPRRRADAAATSSNGRDTGEVTSAASAPSGARFAPT